VSQSAPSPSSPSPRPACAFDAVLYVAFGGPEGLDEIRPFLANVLRGRRIPPERIEVVAHHYELFDGVSPITAITERQARALEAALQAKGLPLTVHVGARNWRPLLVDTCRRLHEAGARRLLVVLAAAHRSYSSCEQYKQNLWQAQEELLAAGLPPFAIAYVGDWHLAQGVLDAVDDRIAAARATLPEGLRDEARLVFTAHSIPTAMRAADRYVMQLHDSATAVATRLGTRDYALVYQSRSGRPEDPWLEPDVNDYLREAHAGGLRAAILVPIGFLADHIEVLYDLDVEARATADELGLALARAEAVNDHPRFVDALAEAVVEVVQRYGRGRPLSILPAEAPAKRELPPPVRPLRQRSDTV
jgi:protoporphyrin/coproporphyrin ferrochelatase